MSFNALYDYVARQKEAVYFILGNAINICFKYQYYRIQIITFFFNVITFQINTHQIESNSFVSYKYKEYIMNYT